MSKSIFARTNKRNASGCISSSCAIPVEDSTWAPRISRRMLFVSERDLRSFQTFMNAGCAIVRRYPSSELRESAKHQTKQGEEEDMLGEAEDGILRELGLQARYAIGRGWVVTESHPESLDQRQPQIIDISDSSRDTASTDIECYFKGLNLSRCGCVEVSGLQKHPATLVAHSQAARLIAMIQHDRLAHRSLE
jgi:hypothetical protein